MSCVTDQYVKRANQVAETQYALIKSALQRTLGFQGWTVKLKSFIAGARSLDEGDLHDNLTTARVYTAWYIHTLRIMIAFWNDDIRGDLVCEVEVQASMVDKSQGFTRFLAIC